MPKTISIPQIRAARGLLQWSQADLARASKISLPSINNLEREILTPRGRTLDQIAAAFAQAGIEFIDGDGVRRRDDVFEVKIHDGVPGVGTFFGDIIKTVAASGGDICAFGINEQKSLHTSAKMLYDYFIQLHSLKLKERIILCEPDKHLIGPPQTTVYRWLPENATGRMPFYVYGQKIAIQKLGKQNRTIVIENTDLAKTFRTHFDFLWRQGKAIPNAAQIQEKLFSDSFSDKMQYK